MLKRVMLLAVAAAGVLGAAGCAVLNRPPVVVVSYAPLYPSSNDDVYLDASQTTDPEGDTLTFTWSLPEVPPTSSTEIDDPDNPSTFFYADQDGDYVVGLVVSDGTNSVQADIDIWANSQAE
jgi:hypothetical protein